MNAKGKDREGMVTGGIYGPLEDGYTKNVKSHVSENVNPYATLNNMDSYQSRYICWYYLFNLFISFVC